MRLTAKERVLLHLLECGQGADQAEVSPELAQEGVARGAGIELRHFAQFVRPLIEEGFVRESRAHVAGVRQRRKVYALTPFGRATAQRLRERVTSEPIRIRDGNAVREGVLHEVLQGAKGRTSLLETIRLVQESGILDLENLRRPLESGMVEQLEDAPHATAFVGRRDELAAITAEGGLARIFVIRGMAGIGKSTLAAKACELHRGRRNLFWHRIRPWESDSMVLAGLGRFLDALDRPGLSSVLRRGEVSLAAEVLRQDLPDTHALLVLDDAHEASRQTFAVLQMIAEAVAGAPDVKLLVLTRRALPFYDVRDVVIKGVVHEIELGGLLPEEVAAFLAADGDQSQLLGLGRRLGGHPLLIELVRKQRPDIPSAVRNVDRFIEETIYRNLSEAEKMTMKAASLYRVPVPRSSLLAIPGCSYESLVTLQERSLLRFVGGDRCDVHDTIREFFSSTLTEMEEQVLGPFAAAQLRGLSDASAAAGDDVASIACLSNALRLVESSEERETLWESLGDANSRIGDLASMTSAYHEALGIVGDSVTAARLHRKLAFALEDRGYMTSAMKEVEAGRAVLGGFEDAELAWLDLARARFVKENFDWKAAERFAISASERFERTHNPAGQALALLEAGFAAAWTGSVAEDGTPWADRSFEAALHLAETVHDPLLVARIHLAMATVIGYGSGDYEAGMMHFAAVESSPPAMADPQVGPALHNQRAWFVLRTKRDVLAAERDLAKGRQMALKVHNAGTLAGLNYQAAVVAAERGLYGEAGRLDEKAGADLRRTGFGAFAADAYFSAGMYYLAAGDWEGYRRTSSVLLSPALAPFTLNQSEKPAVHRALQSLLQGEVGRFEDAFAGILHAQDPFPAHSLGRNAGGWWRYFYYSICLRALGREPEAEEYRRRALDMAKSVQDAQAVTWIQGAFGERVAKALRKHLQTA